ncbi:antibiotic biosynthesis monooxygenase family protein [Rurimicrobium arvi]|uniref:ABM domain-containing protein n=1 Tax=Rurimicrobium arvi TaxID=2049916 RepID=A0ABP8MQJ5_9BACT
MIKRIVQMSFQPEHIEAFRQLFEERKQTIRSFEGCHFLELWQDVNHPNIFFTHSIWESEEHLNHYRFSAFFKETWTLTKSMFAEKAQAWSVQIAG